MPPDATVDREDRTAHAAVTERAIWSDTVLSESTFRFQHYRTYVFPRGPEPMRLLPETTLGHFYNRQSRDTGTYQWVTAFSATRTGPGGLHLIKAGIDLLHSRYEGTSASRPVLVARSDGQVVRRLDFNGATTQHENSTDLALFVQDRLALNRRWYIEFGGRLDRDGILHRVNLTPRAGTAVLLTESGSAVVRGGFGLFYERTPSMAGAFQQFETWTDTRLDPSGALPASATQFTLRSSSDLQHGAQCDLESRLRPPLQQIVGHSCRPARPPRHSRTDRAAGQSQLVVRSPDERWTLPLPRRRNRRRLHARDAGRCARDLRAVDGTGRSQQLYAVFGAVMAPIIGATATRRCQATCRTGCWFAAGCRRRRRWLFLGVADWRTGFPYSRVDQMLDFVGARNSERFPNAFRVELGVERRFKIGKLEPWIGVRANNAFNAFLPADVQANISSPAFGSFYNSEIRQFRMILRFAQ